MNLNQPQIVPPEISRIETIVPKINMVYELIKITVYLLLFAYIFLGGGYPANFVLSIILLVIFSLIFQTVVKKQVVKSLAQVDPSKEHHAVYKLNLIEQKYSLITSSVTDGILTLGISLFLYYYFKLSLTGFALALTFYYLITIVIALLEYSALKRIKPLSVPEELQKQLAQTKSKFRPLNYLALIGIFTYIALQYGLSTNVISAIIAYLILYFLLHASGTKLRNRFVYKK